MSVNPEYNSSLGANQVHDLNATHENYTSVEHIVDEVDAASGDFRYAFNMEGYNYASVHRKCSGGCTMKIFASNDSTAVTGADTGWVDVSSDVLGATGMVDSEDIYFIDTSQKPLQWMVKYSLSDATNAVDVWIRRYS